MEPRAAVGEWDAASGRYTVHAGAGGLGRTQTGVAGALGVPESAVRVVARDVGGNFGTRNSCYPEFALVAWAARRARPAGEVDGRAARGVPGRLPGPRPRARTPSWRSTRTARSSRFRGANTSNVGAHAVSFHPLNKGMAIATTVYHVPAVAMRGARRASPTRRRPRRTAAPAGPRSCSSWSG